MGIVPFVPLCSTREGNKAAQSRAWDPVEKATPWLYILYGFQPKGHSEEQARAMANGNISTPFCFAYEGHSFHSFSCSEKRIAWGVGNNSLVCPACHGGLRHGVEKMWTERLCPWQSQVCPLAPLLGARLCWNEPMCWCLLIRGVSASPVFFFPSLSLVFCGFWWTLPTSTLSPVGLCCIYILTLAEDRRCCFFP